jgi:hypothetical protein
VGEVKYLLSSFFCLKHGQILPIQDYLNFLNRYLEPGIFSTTFKEVLFLLVANFQTKSPDNVFKQKL